MGKPGLSAAKPKKGGYSLGATLLLVTPIIALFFFAGLYVGSQIVNGEGLANPAGATENGLPNTRNDFNLRGADHYPAIVPKVVTDTLESMVGNFHSQHDSIDPPAVSGHAHDVDMEAVTNSHASVKEKPVIAKLASKTSISQSATPAQLAQVTKKRSADVLLPPVATSKQQPVVVPAKQGISDTIASFVLPHAVVPNVQERVPPAASYTSRSGSVPASPMVDKHMSLLAHANSYLQGPATLDHSRVLLSMWVYLDPRKSGVMAGNGDNDMRTIFSNKAAGCENKPDQYGISMYVNGWQTSDHILYVEYGGIKSGCNKIDSAGVRIDTDRWYHVALAMFESTASLFVDGQLVNAVTLTEGHQVQTHKKLILGQYEHGAFPLYGNISQFAVLHFNDYVVSGEVLQSKVDVLRSGNQKNILELTDLVAIYSLNEASTADTGSMAISYQTGGKKGPIGTYVLPAPSKRVDGLPFALVDGTLKRTLTPEVLVESDKLAYTRREQVKNAMKHAWKGYKQHAWGKDELKPLSKRGQDNWGGMGVTLVDSLDTLWLMGMTEEFKEATKWVKDSLTFAHAGSVSVFETTIRELGGLLAAYDMSGEDVFLQKAKQLGDKLSQAFNSPSGLPHGQVNLASGQARGGWSGNAAILSEIGSLQLEFRYLAQHTHTKEFETKSMKAFQLMNKKSPKNGLFPIKVSVTDGSFADRIITFGALGDSFYEYMLKVWLQGGRKESWLRDMYDKSMDGVMNVLLKSSSPSGLAFLSDWNGNGNNLKMDHLVCFVPGMLALGAYTDPNGLDSPRAKRDLAVAKAVMYTCYQMYKRQASGISPEYVDFRAGSDMVVGSSAPFYILRPETAESLFILNQLTGDPIYRDWSWEIFQSIEKHCKTDVGYGALRDVRQAHSGVDDRMESFFLAETLKYLYLAQDPDAKSKGADLMKVVFNTEAHPMKVLDSSHQPVPP